MRQLGVFLAALWIAFAMAAAPGIARAQDSGRQDGARVQFIILGDTVIDGALRTPTVQYHDARDRVRFQRLLHLRRSFLPALMESGTDQIFR